MRSKHQFENSDVVMPTLEYNYGDNNEYWYVNVLFWHLYFGCIILLWVSIMGNLCFVSSFYSIGYGKLTALYNHHIENTLNSTNIKCGFYMFLFLYSLFIIVSISQSWCCLHIIQHKIIQVGSKVLLSQQHALSRHHITHLLRMMFMLLYDIVLDYVDYYHLRWVRWGPLSSIRWRHWKNYISETSRHKERFPINQTTLGTIISIKHIKVPLPT